jgi:hypothetical protein
MPNAQIIDSVGVWGYALTQSDKASACVEMQAQTAITAKTIVAMSTTEGQVVPCATNQSVASVVGVCLNAGVANNPLLIATQGPVFNVVKETASGQNFAQFDRAQFSTTTTGSAALLTSATAITQQKDIGLVIGIAMAAATTGATTVDLFLSRW